jgi:hypothetical protein
VTRQQRMGQQSRLSTWPDVNVLSIHSSGQILTKVQFYGHIFEKYSNITYHENVSRGSLVVHVGGRTDTTKLIVAFRNLANAPKKWTGVHSFCRLHKMNTECKDYSALSYRSFV